MRKRGRNKIFSLNAVRYLDGSTPLDAAQRVVCSEESWTTTSEVNCVRRRVVGTLLRAGATIDPWHAADPTPADLADFEFKDDDDGLTNVPLAVH